jgi:hypothetical protein
VHVDPPRDLLVIELDEMPDLHVRIASFRDEPAHVPVTVSQPGCDPFDIEQWSRTGTRPFAFWHHAHVTNGPTEAANNLIKRVKRAAFGFTSFRNYRIRALLYAGKPNWDLLATITPR